MQERILTPDQVAQILQVHPFTVLKFIKQGKLQASKLGRVYRIRERDLEEFLDHSSSRTPKTDTNTTGESLTKKIKNKNKINLKSDQSNPSLSQLDSPLESSPPPETEKMIPVQEVKVDQIETQGTTQKHGGDDHYYILQ